MSHLISRILLAILMLPLAALAYIITFVAWLEHTSSSYPRRDQIAFVVGGGAAWLFMAGWWYLLWRATVKWTRKRHAMTLASVLAAAFVGLIIGVAAEMIDDPVGYFCGSVAAPVLWLVATTFIWRESSEERAERVRSSGRGAIVCPTCGYNLTGLREARCPECGTAFTIDELLAAQPGLASAELEL